MQAARGQTGLGSQHAAPRSSRALAELSQAEDALEAQPGDSGCWAEVTGTEEPEDVGPQMAAEVNQPLRLTGLQPFQNQAH